MSVVSARSADGRVSAVTGQPVVDATPAFAVSDAAASLAETLGSAVGESALLAGSAFEQARAAVADALDIAHHQSYGALAGDASLMLARATFGVGDGAAAAGHSRAARAAFATVGRPGKLRQVDGLSAEISDAWLAVG